MVEGINQFTNKMINLKLDSPTTLWRQQVGFTIACHRLEGYILMDLRLGILVGFVSIIVNGEFRLVDRLV